MKIFILTIILTHICLTWTKPYYPIVHGTWCRPFSWHMPGGDFHNALVRVVNQTSVFFFIWSGIAIQLVSKLHNNSLIIWQKIQKIKITSHLYALGTPINIQSYEPNMTVIQYLYNLFSFNDFVQPVFGFFKREFVQHPRIVNF